MLISYGLIVTFQEVFFFIKWVRKLSELSKAHFFSFNKTKISNLIKMFFFCSCCARLARCSLPRHCWLVFSFQVTIISKSLIEFFHPSQRSGWEISASGGGSVGYRKILPSYQEFYEQNRHFYSTSTSLNVLPQNGCCKINVLHLISKSI